MYHSYSSSTENKYMPPPPSVPLYLTETRITPVRLSFSPCRHTIVFVQITEGGEGEGVSMSNEDGAVGERQYGSTSSPAPLSQPRGRGRRGAPACVSE